MSPADQLSALVLPGRSFSGPATWTDEPGRVACRYGGATVYDDSEDHWKNAVCRLLGVSTAQARSWVETAAELSLQSAGRSLSALDADARAGFLGQSASRVLFPRQASSPNPCVDLLAALGRTPGPCGHAAENIWQACVGSRDELVVVGCSRCQHGWLAEVSGVGVSPAKAIEYEQDYFEGNIRGLGYGDYIGQQPWRMEKSRRFLRQIMGICQYAGILTLNNLPPRALDVGCGYGLFRKALDEAGWRHDGIELSRHACRSAKSLFGFDTFAGTLEAFAAEAASRPDACPAAPRYDMITLWDVIEHVDDPLSMLRTASQLLRPGGVCALRTPNLLAVEHSIFGRHYHSLKREHLQYFSPRSITLLASRAGLRTVLIATQSTLLAGFSPDDVSLYQATQRGADIFAVLTRE